MGRRARITAAACAAISIAVAPIAAEPAAAATTTTVCGAMPDGSFGVAFVFAPDGTLFVTEKEGLVFKIAPNCGAVTQWLDISGEIESSGEQGLLGVALDTNFATNGVVYLYGTQAGTRANRVLRYSGGLAATASGGTAILTIPREGADLNCTNHDGGNIHFGPDGFLYVTVGEYGCVAEHAQDTTSSTTDSNHLKGKILRIDPHGAGTFTDDNGHFAEAAIEGILAAGVTAGCTTTQFCPNSPVERQQMAVFIDRAVPALPDTAPPGPFVDIAGSYAAASIATIAAAGITAGCDPTHFCPTASITRGEIAVMLVRALGIAEVASGPFVDVAAGAFYAGSVNALAAAGITAGCDPTHYCPNNTLTRGEMAVLLARAFGIVYVDPGTTIPAGNPFGNEIWAFGLRNSFDFTWDPTTDRLWATENGPGSCDEVNIIVAGADYGWPVTCAGNPIDTFTPPVALVGILVYRGTVVPDFTNQVLMCANNTTGLLYTAPLTADGSNIASPFTTQAVPGGFDCTTDIDVGPDGAIYFIDFNTVYRVTGA